ncbi:penicillin-binding protein 2 [Acidihalobacter ferrooxydans]|uniref:Penicillin-binding protein 2 n=1 Tax=Acidihalobacter ferrooxydans TaxID=1765967 RepID=A0A1P8UE44_9GAMM|nr:penicillin-binding protein 2 [Acidihalobacter ferrooxydans]
MVVLAALVFVMLGGAVYRLAELQVLEHRSYALAAHDNRVRIDPVPPPRGLIYSRNGILLAENVPSYALVIVPDDVHHMAQTLQALTRLLNIAPTDLKHFTQLLHRTPPYRAVPLLTELTPKQIAKFAVERYRFAGVHVQAHLVRRYPYRGLTTDSVGYVGRINATELSKVNANNYAGTDYFGKSWLEADYEPQLHGTAGYVVHRVNAGGQPLETLQRHLPVPGQDIVLTLDKGLQEVAQKAMRGKLGAVVVLNPRNGAILALVSSPSFDPNWFVNGISEKRYLSLLNNPAKPLWNRALQAGYAPGSTIKPYIAVGALQDGVVTAKEKIFAGPYYVLPHDPTKHKFWDWTPYGAGMTDLKKAIEESVDTYFYPVAVKMGITRLDRTLAKFGFGKDPMPSLNGVASGLLPSPAWKRRALGQSWYPGDTVVMGIGQGYLQITPLQLAKAVSIIAMHGQGFVPRLVRAWYDPTTHALRPNPPRPLPTIRLRDPKYWSDVIAGMHAVTASPNGTAYPSFIGFPHTVAGKTGTAQLFSTPHTNPFARQAPVPYNLRDNNLFEAFTPIDHPQLAVVVVVEHTGVRIGAASRVARKIMTYWYAHRAQIDRPLHQLKLHTQAKPPAKQSAKPTPHPPGHQVMVTIRAGDTLWQLAHHYGVTVKQLVKWNHFVNAGQPLSIGQQIVVWTQLPVSKGKAP